MVSKSRSLNDLLVALTAAGVPVNLRVESQANPNLLVGIAQGANQAVVRTSGISPIFPALAVSFPSQTVSITPSPLPVSISSHVSSDLFAADNVSLVETALNSFSDGSNLQSLLVHPLGSQHLDLQQEVTTNELQVVQHVGTSGIDPRKPNPGLAETKMAGGGVTSPGALATITSLTPGTAGDYRVEVVVGALGTTAVADDANTQLVVHSVAVGTLANPTGSTQLFGPFHFMLSAIDILNVTTIAAGTIGSRYIGSIIATRTG